MPPTPRPHLALTGPVPELAEIAVRLDDPIPPGPQFIFEGLLPVASEVMIAGMTNVGKSLLSLEILSSFSTGEPLWGKLEPAFRAKKILYVLGEHNSYVVQRLYQKTELPLGCDVFLLGPDALGYDRQLVVKGQVNRAAADKFMKWADGADLIVWDPLASFLTGEGGEQDNTSMRELINTLNQIAGGAASVVLSHQGKPTMDQFGKEHKRTTYATRGASGTEDASTSIFYLDQSEVGGRVYDLTCRKFKGEAPERYRLLRNPITLTHTLVDSDADLISESRRLEMQAKIGRVLQFNRKMGYDTAKALVAAIEGKSVETLDRWLQPT